MRATLESILIAASLMCASAVCQAAPELSVGDQVPEIDIAHFFQGPEVRAFNKDETYVLEFWATW